MLNWEPLMQGSLYPEDSLGGTAGALELASRGTRFRQNRIITIKYSVEHTFTKILFIVYLQFESNWVSCVLSGNPRCGITRRVRSPSPACCIAQGSATQQVGPTRPFCGVILGVVSGCRTFLPGPPALPRIPWEPQCPCNKSFF